MEKKLDAELVIRCLENLMSHDSTAKPEYLQNAIDLIRHLQSENEHLKCNSKRDNWKNKFLRELAAKEQLQDENIRLKNAYRAGLEQSKFDSQMKTPKDTAKEIYDQLCGHGTTYVKKWIKERFGVEDENV